MTCFSLSLLHLFQVTNASYNGIHMDSIYYNLHEATVTFRWHTLLPKGYGSLIIQFQGILNSEMTGFYRSTYIDVDGTLQLMGSTQFAALDARRAFICVDEPGVKATFSVSLTIPKNLTAISNMPELSCTHLPNRKFISIWWHNVFLFTHNLKFYHN